MSDPRCPKCGAATRLVEPRSGQSWKPFYSCSNYKATGCKGTAPYNGSKGYRKATKGNYTKPEQLGVKPAGVVGSPQQTAIWRAILAGVGHIIVQALAGTGKSFTALMGMFDLLEAKPTARILYIAFSRAIVNEFLPQSPKGTTIDTFNALGNKILLAHGRQQGIKVNFDNRKLDYLFDGLWKPTTPEQVKFAKRLLACVKSLANLCKGYLVDGTDKVALLELADKHEIEIDSVYADIACELVPKILEAAKSQLAVIDYGDQVWLPVVLNLPCPQFDYIMVDEAQDLNKCKHFFSLRLIEKSNGKIIAIGDDNQAIFGFTGSDTDSISNFATLLAERTGLAVTSFPLTVSRRCPQIIAEEARRIVPDFQALDNAARGEIEHLDDTLALAAYQPTDMVVCRMNAPLTRVAYRLIKSGVKAVIRGRDIGEGLITLIDRLGCSTINELLIAIDNWQSEEIEKVKGTRREDTVTLAVQDRADCIRVLACERADIVDLKATITSIFQSFDADGTPKEAVILSTIHRAKGLEANGVYYLWPEITIKTTQDWQAKQERNLRYVAITRAKRRLVYVSQPTGPVKELGA